MQDALSQNNEQGTPFQAISFKSRWFFLANIVCTPGKPGDILPIDNASNVAKNQIYLCQVFFFTFLACGMTVASDSW